MFDIHHKHHIYYKWRTFSFAQGDSERIWRVEPFQITVGGPVWIPPPIPLYNKEDAKGKRVQKEDSDGVKDNEDLEYFKLISKKGKTGVVDEEIVRLPYQLKREFLAILEEVTVKQTDICNAMIFVMENTEYAKPIISILKEKISECEDYDKISS